MLSMLIMDLGNIAHKQIVKGLMFLAIEVAYLYYMISYGFYAVSHLCHHLGWRERGKGSKNDAKSIYEYQAGDIRSLSYFMELQHYILPSYLSLYGGSSKKFI